MQVISVVFVFVFFLTNRTDDQKERAEKDPFFKQGKNQNLKVSKDFENFDHYVLAMEAAELAEEGQRVPPVNELLRFWSEWFLVVVVPEHNTSKLCSSCLHKSLHHRKEDRDIRSKCCSNCGLMYDRDEDAAINMLRIVVSVLVHGTVPRKCQGRSVLEVGARGGLKCRCFPLIRLFQCLVRDGGWKKVTKGAPQAPSEQVRHVAKKPMNHPEKAGYFVLASMPADPKPQKNKKSTDKKKDNSDQKRKNKMMKQTVKERDDILVSCKGN